MDENTKEIALQYMREFEGRISMPSKFPFKLSDEKTIQASLLGSYGAVVSGRGVSFTIDDNVVSKIEKVSRWMLESQKRGLLLCGTVGNGKTTMLKAMKNLFGTYAVYTESQAVLEYFKTNQSLPQVSPRDILLIDDLGAEAPGYNDFGQIRYPLTELLISRYNSNSTTILASNCTFDQIGEIYGDRLKDRMREMFVMVKYTETSYRLSL